MTASGDRGTENGLVSLPSPLDAVDELRSTAKWTIAAAGAVGAVLISGGPLVAVGRIHGAGHALLAGAGLVIAVIGVGLSIWSTSQVLSPRLTTPATLRSPALAKLRAILEEDPAQFFGAAATKIDALLLHREVGVNLARLLDHEIDPAKRAKLRGKLQQAERNARRAAPYVRWLLALGHVWQIKQALERSRWVTLAGSILVIAGAVLFFLATGGNRPTYVPVPTPSQVTAIPSTTAPPAPVSGSLATPPASLSRLRMTSGR
jgi:hypothetical protein